MRKNYFIVVLAHSVHGRIHRIHIPQYFLYVVMAFAVLGGITCLGFVSSYARMLFKVSNYNNLRTEKEALKKRYDNLQQVVVQTNTQLASLETLASEVSMAYGLKRKLLGPDDVSHEGVLVPSYQASLEQFNFLHNIPLSQPGGIAPSYWLENTMPSIWPVQGLLTGHFGSRIDPFQGEGAFHAGVDISSAYGSPVVATADGVVAMAGFMSGYGRLIVLQHGKTGFSTYYAHLSQSYVRPNQVVRRGEIIGRVGRSGRTTSAHLHYEVRRKNGPVNPTPYLRGAFRQFARLQSNLSPRL
ncbi:MAG TPA: M23 family metallopeptidase [Bryobacterales bacterium]|nr:M23 family metallopeptidase [Bryobacterales bacterium]